MHNYESTRGSEKKDDQWELKKIFMNARQIYHESWMKHQNIAFEEQKGKINPMYMRVNGDTKKPIRNELIEDNHKRINSAKANDPPRFSISDKAIGQARGNQVTANIFRVFTVYDSSKFGEHNPEDKKGQGRLQVQSWKLV